MRSLPLPRPGRNVPNSVSLFYSFFSPLFRQPTRPLTRGLHPHIFRLRWCPYRWPRGRRPDRKRESGATPGLPRSGERKRPPPQSTGRASGKRRALGTRPGIGRPVRQSEDLPTSVRETGSRTIRHGSLAGGRPGHQARHARSPALVCFHPPAPVNGARHVRRPGE